jgi:hypothetical protein
MSTKEVRPQVLTPGGAPPPPFQWPWQKLGLERNIFEHTLADSLPNERFFTMLQTLLSSLLLLNHFLSIYPLPFSSTFLYEFSIIFLNTDLCCFRRIYIPWIRTYISLRYSLCKEHSYLFSIDSSLLDSDELWIIFSYSEKGTVQVLYTEAGGWCIRSTTV